MRNAGALGRLCGWGMVATLLGAAGACGSSTKSTGSTGTGVGGSTGAGGSPAGQGSAGTGGSTGTGTGAGGSGVPTGAGGSGAPGGSGGSGTPTGSGGSGVSTGAGGAGGAAGMGAAGGGSSFGQPACPGTVAKGAPCGSSDVQFCYKTCGPEKTGVKAETCQTSGAYAEMSGCMFDSTVDYSCYKLPTLGNAACGASATPINGSTCDVSACTICNSLEGASGGSYFDSSGATKVGYCVCQAPNSAGTRTWSCASDTAWPCPGGSGC